MAGDGVRLSVPAVSSAEAMPSSTQMAAVRDTQAHEELSKQAVTLVAHQELARARSAYVENELANWNLLARCMSNDGLIALAIDDAGPALSALANDLLLAWCGPRFTVSMHTLLETAKGDQKEGSSGMRREAAGELTRPADKTRPLPVIRSAAKSSRR